MWQCFNKATLIYNAEIKRCTHRERVPAQKVNTSFINPKEGEFTMNSAISLISVEWLNPYIKEKRKYLSLKFRSKTSLYSRITRKGRSAKGKYPGGKLFF